MSDKTFGYNKKNIKINFRKRNNREVENLGRSTGYTARDC